jgi:hypothetical protein
MGRQHDDMSLTFRFTGKYVKDEKTYLSNIFVSYGHQAVRSARPVFI